MGHTRPILTLSVCALALLTGLARAQDLTLSEKPITQPFAGDGFVPPVADDAISPFAATTLPSSQPAAPKISLWRFSVAVLTAANAVDISSSWKKKELNPTLAASSQRFGAQDALLKSAIVGAVLGVEYFATRGHRRPGLYRTLTILNFLSAGGIAAVAAHNYSLPAS